MQQLTLRTTKIIAEIQQGVGWLTFNQPERRNAISLEMWQGIGDALELMEADANLRVVIMKGAGGKAFASGADISEFDQQRANAAQRQQYAQISGRGSQWLARFSKPLIALIDGYCIGGGLAIALNADVRFATPGSRLGIPAARLGLGYEYSGLAALARLVGPSTARDMLFSARLLNADEAYKVGLLNFIATEDTIVDQVMAYAEQIAKNAPLTIKAAKAAVNAFEKYSQVDAAHAIAEMVDACFDSDDYKEGRRAFAEKRPPQFKGR
jgi:enoyl-CoA hydratase